MPIEKKQLIISSKTHSSYALHTSTHNTNTNHATVHILRGSGISLEYTWCHIDLIWNMLFVLMFFSWEIQSRVPCAFKEHWKEDGGTRICRYALPWHWFQEGRDWSRTAGPHLIILSILAQAISGLLVPLLCGGTQLWGRANKKKSFQRNGEGMSSVSYNICSREWLYSESWKWDLLKPLNAYIIFYLMHSMTGDFSSNLKGLVQKDIAWRSMASHLRDLHRCW